MQIVVKIMDKENSDGCHRSFFERTQLGKVSRVQADGFIDYEKNKKAVVSSVSALNPTFLIRIRF